MLSAWHLLPISLCFVDQPHILSVRNNRCYAKFFKYLFEVHKPNLMYSLDTLQ